MQNGKGLNKSMIKWARKQRERRFDADMQESWRVTNEMLGKLTGEEEGAKKGPTDWRGWLNKQAKMRQADADADEQLRPAAF